MARGRAARWLALPLAAALLGSACTGDDVTPGPDPAVAMPTDADVGVPAVDEPDARIRAAVTQTGIPVEVLDLDRWTASVRTPCGAVAVVQDWRPVPAVDVVLDPGHGGPRDTGALSPSGDTEADLNLRVVEAVGAELDRRGVSWASTRTGDYPVLLSVRAELADALGARLMVSVHHNAPASATSDVPGTEVYVQTEDADSIRLGGLVHDEVVAALSRFDVAWTRAHDAGVLSVLTGDGHDAYGILRRPATPTVLLEAGYLDNPAEAALFGTQAYLDAMATAVADAISSFLGTAEEPATSPGAPRRFSGVRAPSTESCEEPALEH